MAKEAMVPLNLRVPQSMLDQVDERAAALGHDRSEFIRNAISCLLEIGRPQSVEMRLADLEWRLSKLEAPQVITDDV